MNVAEYTQNEIEKALILLELHLRQYPMCIFCIQKDLYILEGLLEEGIKFLPSKIDKIKELINWIQIYQSPVNINYAEVLKQLLLLQIHLQDFLLYQKNKEILFCKDCLQKHLLLIEKLIREGNKITEFAEIINLIQDIKENLVNLTLEKVNNYLDNIKKIIDVVMLNLNIDKINALTDEDRKEMIHQIDKFRRDFLPPSKCFKCQAQALVEHL